jgi:hypothetical protein
MRFEARHRRADISTKTSLAGRRADGTIAATSLRLIEHLEAAQAITDELGLDQTGYLVERALDDARAVHWPHIDPNVEAFRRPPENR